MIEKLELHRDDGAAYVARHWIGDQIDALGYAGDRRADVVLLVSELVENVIRHTESRPGVTFAVEPDRLVVSVDDASPQEPVLRATEDGPGGWGLRLVDQVSDAWGTVYRGTAKTVWFSIDVGP